MDGVAMDDQGEWRGSVTAKLDDILRRIEGLEKQVTVMGNHEWRITQLEKAQVEGRRDRLTTLGIWVVGLVGLGEVILGLLRLVGG
jgi:hypothetical protein